MALTTLEYSYDGKRDFHLPEEWSHSGVVGSGDMEILMESKEQDGKITFKVVTPVTGFDHVWQKVLERFVEEEEIGNLHIEINDNNATPFIVTLRLRQAINEVIRGRSN